MEEASSSVLEMETALSDIERLDEEARYDLMVLPFTKVSQNRKGI